MKQSYFTFLYNECKRLNPSGADVAQIKQFIESPEGQKGYQAFCVMRGHKPEKNNVKSVADVITGFIYER